MTAAQSTTYEELEAERDAWRAAYTNARRTTLRKLLGNVSENDLSWLSTHNGPFTSEARNRRLRRLRERLYAAVREVASAPNRKTP